MIRAKNYEKLSKFVKVTAGILSVSYFPDTVYMEQLARNSNISRYIRHFEKRLDKFWKHQDR